MPGTVLSQSPRPPSEKLCLKKVGNLPSQPVNMRRSRDLNSHPCDLDIRAGSTALLQMHSRPSQRPLQPTCTCPPPARCHVGQEYQQPLTGLWSHPRLPLAHAPPVQSSPKSSQFSLHSPQLSLLSTASQAAVTTSSPNSTPYHGQSYISTQIIIWLSLLLLRTFDSP